jgi:2-oxoglutarate ferredoxin oxidoreductase subunit beta
MAPTTMPGQITTTCPHGRDPRQVGFPIRVVEMLSTLQTPAYLERVSVHSPRHIIQAKKAIKRAFTYQKEGTCFSLIEVVSTCPTNWGKTPAEATRWLDENLLPYYPLGVFKTPPAERTEVV